MQRSKLALTLATLVAALTMGGCMQNLMSKDDGAEATAEAKDAGAAEVKDAATAPEAAAKEGAAK